MPFVRRKSGQVLIAHSARHEGGVRQDVLARFSSPEALAVVLQAWDAWVADMSWRFDEIRWDFPRIRERLTEELEKWSKQARGAKVRQRRKLARAVVALRDDLSGLSIADPSDAVLVDESRQALVGLAQVIDRLLQDPLPANHTKTTEEMRLLEFPEGDQMHHLEFTQTPAQSLFDDGMEHWWNGDRRQASRLYRRALKLEPTYGDALVHLGIHAFDSGRIKKAVEYYEAALTAEEPKLICEGTEVAWGHLENRPYLRALGNLALCHRRRRHWEEALMIHQQMLHLNPNDNQGVRSLVGEELHRVGRLEEAIVAHENARDFPECNFGLALTLVAAERAEEAALPLLRGMAANRYMAAMLLGEPWQRLRSGHVCSTDEPEVADEYVMTTRDLWRKTPGSARFLRAWWAAAPVRVWRDEIDSLMTDLHTIETGDARSRLASRLFERTGDHYLEELVQRVREVS